MIGTAARTAFGLLALRRIGQDQGRLAFAEKFNLPFLLLSDGDRELAGKIGAAPRLLPYPKRISYLVGADGKVLKAYPKVSPAKHAGEVLRDFRTLTADDGE